MSEHGHVLWSADRGARASAVDAVRDLGYCRDLLTAAVIEAGGSIELGYEATGAATLQSIEILAREDGLGLTVRLEGSDVLPTKGAE